MDNQEKKQAHELVRKLRRLGKQQTHNFWEEARICYLLENGMYKLVAEDKTDLYRLLDMPRATVYYKSRLWEFYREKHKLDLDDLQDVSPKYLYVHLPTFREYSKERLLHALRKA